MKQIDELLDAEVEYYHRTGRRLILDGDVPARLAEARRRLAALPPGARAMFATSPIDGFADPGGSR